MTEIFFSFDTEDYVNEAAADGILRTAQILRKEGIRGCYNVVGWLAEALVKWGRWDIIEELKHHEIETHSLAHSYHPTINEYTDIADFDKAMEAFLEREQKSLKILQDTFGITSVPAACPPGDSVSYVAHYGYADMGISVYDGDLLRDPVRGRHIFACNIACLDYHMGLDSYLLQCTKADIDAKLEEIASQKDMFVMYHHPQKGIVTEFCDILNFNGENVPEDQWKLSALRDPEERERFYENFAYLVHKVKHDPRFRILTYGEFAQLHCKDVRVIRPADLTGLKQQLQEHFFPVTMPESYCISDILLACRDFLQGKQEHLCEKVYGFLETPYAISEAVTVTAQEVRDAAAAIGDGFLPTKLQVGNQQIGVGDWLWAAMEVLEGAESVTLQPRPWQIDMDQFPKTRDLNLKGSWVHSASFEDRYLSERFRLQSWTYRLPKNTPRLIFA